MDTGTREGGDHVVKGIGVKADAFFVPGRSGPPPLYFFDILTRHTSGPWRRYSQANWPSRSWRKE